MDLKEKSVSYHVKEDEMIKSIRINKNRRLDYNRIHSKLLMERSFID
jgi:hypothetical protein